jgi:hypothetical protein
VYVRVKWVRINSGGRVLTGFIWLRAETSGGCYELSDKPADSINVGNFTSCKIF